MAGIPSVVISTLMGPYVAYGMTGMRNDTSSIILFGVVNVIQALVAGQLLIACIFLTSNQVLKPDWHKKP